MAETIKRLRGEVGVAKVLVVDDQEPYRKYVSRRLARDGHAVETAGTSAEALVRGREFEPDVLVADWMLRNGRTGIDVCVELRRDLAALFVVLISGYPESDFAVDAERAGIDKILSKPFSLNEVADLVEQAMSR